jgi:hypothetical protein
MAESSPQKNRAFWWLILLGLLVFIYGHYWPIVDLMERSTQRRQVLERVQAAGGWDALRRDCALLASTNAGGFSWSWLRRDTNSLPPAIGAMHPRRVEFYPNQINPHVRIFIFGTHNTDGHDQPSLGLDVLCESGVTNYTSADNLRSDIPRRYWEYRKIADGIYEFY